MDKMRRARKKGNGILITEFISHCSERQCEDVSILAMHRIGLIPGLYILGKWEVRILVFKHLEDSSYIHQVL